jgi:hypothetical protein
VKAALDAVLYGILDLAKHPLHLSPTHTSMK